MNITIKINKQGVFTGKIFPAAGLLFFVLVMGFCAFYVSTGYYHLVSWYTGLNNCFYRHGQWTTDFFSNKTKDAGNLFCIPAFIIALAGAWLMIRKLKAGYKRPTEYLEISLRKADVAVAALLVLLSVVAWFWATTLAFPSNDEVFSAVNCAGLHPFQTVSYYMLPNNHLFYNFINNLLFHFVADKVASGRFLSLLFYLAIVLVTFSWLRGLLKSRWLAFLIVVALALQFPVWGFASQARGYELVTLASWLAFISLLQYHLEPHRKWLYLSGVAIVAGYFTLPSFLYLHFGMALAAVCFQVYNKKADRQFWIMQLYTLRIVYMLYLPCICFSGLEAIVGNKYVHAYQSKAEFIGDILPNVRNYMDYCFFNFLLPNHILDYVLFLTPLCLFFFKENRMAKMLGWFYVVQWLAVVLITIKMGLFPIDRALCGQFSISLFICLYTVYCGLQYLLEKRAVPDVITMCMLVLTAGLSTNYVIKGRENIWHYLCHFNVNMWHDIMLTGVKTMPKGSTAAFSDESFYLYYLSKQNGQQARQCRQGDEDFFINMNEAFPPGIAEHYESFSTAGDYYIYKRKR